MALPKAVQQQVDQAEVLQQQLYTEGQASEAPIEQTAPAEPAAEPPSNVVEMPRQAEQVAQVETPKPVQSDDDVAYWKKKFDSLQGKFNAEVPQLYQQLKEQNQQVQSLMQRLDEKNAADAEQAPQASEKDAQDAEGFGPDLVEMIERRAQAKTSKAVAELEARLRKEFGVVQEQVGHVQERVYQSESDKFWGSVMSLVPDWQQIDQSPQWIEFLDTTPEFAEDTYRQLATKAIQKGDAQKIANLVARWRGPQQAAPAPRAAQNPELQRQVAPSTTKSGNLPPQGGKIWTLAEYESAMDVRNVSRLGQKEADRLEAEANAAVAEGRVHW